MNDARHGVHLAGVHDSAIDESMSGPVVLRFHFSGLRRVPVPPAMPPAPPDPGQTANPGRCVASLLAFLLLPVISGCASVPLQPAGSLSSYDQLVPSDGVLTHARVAVSHDEVLAARTVRILPTSYAGDAGSKLSDVQRKLLANAISRSLCIGMSDRFSIVPEGPPPDLIVHATITQVIPTDEKAAAASKVISLGTSIATSAMNVTAPMPLSRLPIGLGGLALEAEARDPAGRQKAAMMWARGADILTSKPRVSTDGDAYDLSGSFGEDFSKLLVTGKSPFKTTPSLPSMQSLVSKLGGAPKEAACDAYGRTGMSDLIAGSMALPPDWTDKGAPPEAQATN